MNEGSGLLLLSSTYASFLSLARKNPLPLKSPSPLSPTAGLNLCEKCGKSATTTKRCGGCKLVRYCSQECQLQDWRAHKVDCKRAKQKQKEEEKEAEEKEAEEKEAEGIEEEKDNEKGKDSE